MLALKSAMQGHVRVRPGSALRLVTEVATHLSVCVCMCTCMLIAARADQHVFVTMAACVLARVMYLGGCVCASMLA
jgi:hypothetical protein